MKLRTQITLVLAFLLITAGSAFASTSDYSFHYLVDGQATLDGTTTPFSGTYDLGFSTAAHDGEWDGSTYYIPFSNTDYNGLSININGRDLFQAIPFDYSNAYAAATFKEDGSFLSFGLLYDYTLKNGLMVQNDVFSFLMDTSMFSGEFLSELTKLGKTLVSTEGSISGTLSPTPIPGAIWLLGSGLLGLVGLRRRMQA